MELTAKFKSADQAAPAATDVGSAAATQLDLFESYRQICSLHALQHVPAMTHFKFQTCKHKGSCTEQLTSCLSSLARSPWTKR